MVQVRVLAGVQMENMLQKISDIVNTYPTRFPGGFLRVEIREVIGVLKYNLPEEYKWDEDAAWGSMMAVTVFIPEGVPGPLYPHSDVRTMLKAGIGEKISPAEWD